jgi:hypothetical protein
MVDRPPGSNQQIVEIPLNCDQGDVSLRRVLEKREGAEGLTLTPRCVRQGA